MVGRHDLFLELIYPGKGGGARDTRSILKEVSRGRKSFIDILV